MKRYAIVSLGCTRNLVDSEVVAGTLKECGYKQGELKDGVDLCVVNTCAFIKSAREESVDSIMEIAALKKEGKVGRLVVCGCLPQLYKSKLGRSLPEADLILGTGDFPRLARYIRGISASGRRSVTGKPDYLYDDRSPRQLLTPRHYAYVKVSEGCSNLCTYCIISRLRGRFRSRSIDSVVREVARLSARSGGRLKEIDLVGQDTTLFGMDRYGAMVLPQLLRKICALENSIGWVRILYTHPAHYTDELIATVRGEGRVCKYLDLPIQHINDRVLARMNRQTTKRGITDLIARLRRAIPGLTLRTSVIVGFPGETDREFGELLDFLKEVRFERLGAFVYSREEGTKAARFAPHVPEAVKQERFDAVMKLQQKISSEANSRFLGKTVTVLIDGREEGASDVFTGRTEGDAPDVDGVVYVSGKGLRAGEFRRVRITDTLEYDLVGKAV